LSQVAIEYDLIKASGNYQYIEKRALIRRAHDPAQINFIKNTLGRPNWGLA
jgi:hypothetical protein